MARHVEPGGVVVIEPWLRLEDIRAGHIGFSTVNEPELKLARMNIVRLEGREWHMNMHYLVGTPDGIESFDESHVLSSFTGDEFRSAFEDAGFVAEWDPEGVSGRGVWIGKSSGSS